MKYIILFLLFTVSVWADPLPPLTVVTEAQMMSTVPASVQAEDRAWTNRLRPPVVPWMSDQKQWLRHQINPIGRRNTRMILTAISFGFSWGGTELIPILTNTTIKPAYFVYQEWQESKAISKEDHPEHGMAGDIAEPFWDAGVRIIH